MQLPRLSDLSGTPGAPCSAPEPNLAPENAALVPVPDAARGSVPSYYSKTCKLGQSQATTRKRVNNAPVTPSKFL